MQIDVSENSEAEIAPIHKNEVAKMWENLATSEHSKILQVCFPIFAKTRSFYCTHLRRRTVKELNKHHSVDHTNLRMAIPSHQL